MSPMLAFLFESPFAAMVAGGLAVGIPFLIHLLRRLQRREVTLPTLRFLLEARRNQEKKLRIEQWLLLLLRSAMVLLLVGACAAAMPWAEPYWRKLFPTLMGEMEASQVSSHSIIVLDNSLSMLARNGNETSMEAARRKIHEYIQGQGPLASFTLVTMGWPAKVWISDPSPEAARVAKIVDEVPASHTPTDLQGALANVENLLVRYAGQFRENQVVFFSDMQRSAWSSSPGSQLQSMFARIGSKAKPRLLDVGKQVASNRAITSFEMENAIAQTTTSAFFNARIQSFGARPGDLTHVKISFARLRPGKDIGGLQPFAEETIDLRESSMGNVRFSVPFREPGEYAVQLELEPDDLLEDNKAFAVVRVTRELDVLLVHGKSSQRELDRSGGFLKLALDDDGDGSAPVRMKVRQVDEFRFAEELAKPGNPPDCVLLADIPRFRMAEVKSLEEFCLGGTGVVFFGGEQVQMANYNDLLFNKGMGLLPCRLEKPSNQKPDGVYRLQVDQPSFLQPPWKAFALQEDRQSLLAPAFLRAWEVELAPRSAARILATFEIAQKAVDKRLPALVGWQPRLPGATVSSSPVRCQGWVYWFGSTANTDWNNWPAYPSYLPFVQEIVLAASSGRNHALSLVAGGMIEDYSQSGSSEAVVHLPGGTTETVTLEKTISAKRLAFVDTFVSGFYLVRYPDGALGKHFAVNPFLAGGSDNAMESDLSRMTIQEVAGLYPTAGFENKSSNGEIQASAGDSSSNDGVGRGILREKIAWWFLFVLFALGIFELFLAGMSSWNRSQVSEKNRGWWMVLLSAALLLLVMVLIISVARSRQGEEFMAWLGDDVRLGVGVMPKISGEMEEIGVRSRLVGQRGTGYWMMAEKTATLILFVVFLCNLFFMSRHWSKRHMPWWVSVLGLRMSFWWVLLFLLLPQIGLALDRFGKSELIVLVDDSRSMTVRDHYEDEARKKTFAAISGKNAQPASRMEIARQILVDSRDGILTTLLDKKYRLKIYTLSDRAREFSQASHKSDMEKTMELVRKLDVGNESDSSQLGSGIRQVLQENRGASLHGVIFLTDGVVTSGESLAKVGALARQEGVPFFVVGIGEGVEPRDLAITDIQGPDEIPLGDKVILDAQLVAKGLDKRKVQVLLREKNQKAIIEKQEIDIDGAGGVSSVKFSVQPATEGRKIYEVEVVAVPGEVQLQNNRLEKSVLVVPSQSSKVLYVEGGRRYEYHYLKMLLERQAEMPGGKKSFEFKTLLLEADVDFAAQDRSALSDFPSRSELFKYDSVLLGDIDPKPQDPVKLARFLGDLQEFVRDRGGGLLVISGSRFMPSGFTQTPLREMLPVEFGVKNQEESPEGIASGYKLEITPVMMGHPLFRFLPEEKQNAEVWARLRDMYWYAQGVTLKKGAQLLAKLRESPAGLQGGSVPLIAQHYYGAGRVLYFGFDETWRWGYREDQSYFNQFWLQALRYLSRTTKTSISLKLDKQGSYQRGETILVTVRLLQEGAGREVVNQVRVAMERTGLQDAKDRESRILQLSHIPGSEGAYQARVDNVREGNYEFKLVLPVVVDPVPMAKTIVLAPPGEMEKVLMARSDLANLAETTRGRFYQPDQYQKLSEDLPPPRETPLRAATPIQDLWNHPMLFLLIVGLLAGNWLVSRRLNLL